MSNKTKYLISILIAVLVILSCGKSDKTDTSKEKATEPPGQNSGEQNQGSSKEKIDSIKTSKPVLKWDFRPLKPGQYDSPNTDVYLSVNGKSHFVKKIYYSFSETRVLDYADNKIPGDALIACRGWWAGAGIDYWVIKEGNELVVMGREIGETSDDAGNPGDFMGKPFKVVSIKLE